MLNEILSTLDPVDYQPENRNKLWYELRKMPLWNTKLLSEGEVMFQWPNEDQFKLMNQQEAKLKTISFRSTG